MRRRKLLLRAVGTALSSLCHQPISSPCPIKILERRLSCGIPGSPPDSFLKLVRPVHTRWLEGAGTRQSCDAGGRTWDCVCFGAGFQALRCFRSEGVEREVLGDEVIGKGNGQGLQESASCARDGSECENDDRPQGEQGLESGSEVAAEGYGIQDSVLQEIRQRIAKRRETRMAAAEMVTAGRAELADMEAAVDDEVDVAARVLKQAFDVLEGYVPENEQRSLSVAIVGPPNAGKSALTNILVGSKVSAVSRKTNTTHADHLGVYTEGDSQLVIYDTPGLTLDTRGYPLRSSRIASVDTAWHTSETCEALVVVVDAHRQIIRPDKRVERLVAKLGEEDDWEKKRILCLNKVDLIADKKTLLPLAEQFSQLVTFDRVFMISGKSGSGVKDVRQYLIDQCILRMWQYEPGKRTQTAKEDLALEVVREHMYDRIHEEIPYAINHHHVSWKVLKDGSIRIEQHLVVQKEDHKKILVGKSGAVIREIGMGARLDLQKLLGCTVHLALDVRTKAAFSSDEYIQTQI